MEAASWHAGKTRDEHGDHGAALHVAHGYPRVDQRVLKGKAAAQEKGDQIIPPEVADVATLLDQLAPAVDAVARQIRAEVCSRGGAHRLRITRWSDLDKRAGRGVARAEGGELYSRLLRKDDKVGLLVCRTVPGGRATPFATACGCPHVSGGGRYEHGIPPLRQPVGWVWSDGCTLTPRLSRTVPQLRLPHVGRVDSRPDCR